MPLFDIQTKITGTAAGQVVAECEDMALDMFRNGDVIMEIEDWDVEVESYRGGFVDVSKSNQVVVGEEPKP
jgi:hypothetical protein